MALHRITRARPLVLLLVGTAVAVASVGLLAFRELRATTPAPARSAVPAAPSCTPADPCLAIVIDDIGRDPAALRRLLATGAELTYGLLPHAPHTRLAAAEIRNHGREILAHLPMLPEDSGQITDEPLVIGRDGPIGAAVEVCLEQIPGAVGANNHMGSAVSRDREAGRELATTLGRRGLWLLDSRTAPESVLCQVARAAAVPCVERDVFLDDPPGGPAVKSAMARAVAIARVRGWAIAIGHPFPSTVAALATWLEREPVRVVRLSALVGQDRP